MGDVIMNENNSKTKEVKLNLPKPFDRERENLQKFIQDGELYLIINKEIYKDDIKKIRFFLSFITKKMLPPGKNSCLRMPHHRTKP
jgi:hypothetical protein